MAPSAYLTPPQTCESTADMVRRYDGSSDPRSGETRVVYQLPEYAAGEVRDFFAHTAVAEFDPPFLAHLPGGRVFGSGVVLSPDGSSIARDVSLDFGKPLHEHWVLGFERIRAAVELKGTTGVAATALGSGYCHWLLEELPRCLALRTHHCDTIIAHTKMHFAQEALDAIAFAGVMLEPGRTSHYACEELLIPSLLGAAGFPTPTLMATITEFAATLPRPAVSGELIYVSRGKARRRRTTNEAELWSELEARGFRKVHLEDLSWSEQIGVFENAKVVVAPHGAGLANLVFCSRGTRVIEYFNRAYVDGYFWRLAALKGLDYRPVVAASSEPLRSELAANRLDFDADIPQVLRALG